MKIELNQEVIVVGIGNNARYKTPIHEGKVSKIGRKWFEVDTFDREKFSLEDGRSDGKGYMPEWQVFNSLDDYNEYLNKPKLINEITRDLNKLLNYKQLVEVQLLIKSFNAENK